MANAVGDSLDMPLYGAHYLVSFPILDADGDPVTGATGLDSEVSIDLGTFADCTNEATELATNSGIYYLYLTGAEMSGKIITVRIQTSSTGAKTTVLSIHPRYLPTLESGTAQAGAAGTITLASGAVAQDSHYNGMFVLISNNSPAGAQYQARRILSYVGSTRVATVESNWGTNPSSASTYNVLVPEHAAVHAWGGTIAPATNTAGYPLVDTAKVSGTAQTARDLGASVLLSTGTGTGQLDFTSGVVKANVTQCAGGTVPAGAIPNTVAGATGGLFIAGTNAATTVTTSFTSTFTGNLIGSAASVTGNVGGNVVGSVASVSGNVGGNVLGSVAGSVNSVTTGVTLAAAGMDNVTVEAGLNARQALSIVAAGTAGVLAGAGTPSITIAGAGVATNRISATVVVLTGERTAVTLNPPA